MSRAQRRASCVFCGGSKLTKEHVYPKWLRALYDAGDQVLVLVTTSEGVKRTRPQVPFDITVRATCARCNNGWMSGLEERTKPVLAPLIRGERRPLTLDQQLLIAIWSFKTALMLQEQAPIADHAIPDGLYGELFDRQRPPDGVRIWLAAQQNSLTGPVSAAMASADRMFVSQSDDLGIPVGTLFFGVMIGLGALVLCVLGNAEGQGVPEVVDARMRQYLVPVFPGDPQAEWPPNRSVQEIGGFEGLHEVLFGKAGEMRIYRRG